MKPSLRDLLHTRLTTKTPASIRAYEHILGLDNIRKSKKNYAIVMVPRPLDGRMMLWPAEVYKASNFPYDAEKAARKHLASMRVYEEMGYGPVYFMPANVTMYPEEVMLYKKQPIVEVTQIIEFSHINVHARHMVIRSLVTYRVEKNMIYVRLERPSQIHDSIGIDSCYFISLEEVNIDHPMVASSTLYDVTVGNEIMATYLDKFCIKRCFEMTVSVKNRHLVLAIVKVAETNLVCKPGEHPTNINGRMWLDAIEVTWMIPR